MWCCAPALLAEEAAGGSTPASPMMTSWEVSPLRLPQASAARTTLYPDTTWPNTCGTEAHRGPSICLCWPGSPCVIAFDSSACAVPLALEC